MMWTSESSNYNFIIECNKEDRYLLVIKDKDTNKIIFENEYASYLTASQRAYRKYSKDGLKRFKNQNTPSKIKCDLNPSKYHGLLRDNLIKEYIEDGMSAQEIADKYDVTKWIVKNALRKEKLKRERPYKRGNFTQSMPIVIHLLKENMIEIKSIEDNRIILKNNNILNVFTSNTGDRATFSLSDRKETGVILGENRSKGSDKRYKVLYEHRYDYIVFVWVHIKGVFFWIVPSKEVDSWGVSINFNPYNPYDKNYKYQNAWLLIKNKQTL